jgi:hypothetical protein
MREFEEAHLDVLQNIEAVIVTVFKQHPQLADFQVDSALEALGRTYAGEVRGKAPVLPKSELAKEVYQAVRGVCEWRMGRENMIDESGQPLPSESAVTREEILGCLKRIRKSIATWNQKGGSQGYLNYVRQFIV